MSDKPPYICVAQTRREFLAQLGAGATAFAVGDFGVSFWGRSPENIASSPAAGTYGSASSPTLVIIEMGGGNDGLNMVVPLESGRYFDLRGDLAIADPIELEPAVGLYPALQFVAERYRTGDIAIVAGVGYPEPDLSHFASMSTWWSGLPGTIGRTGWLGRYLDGVVGSADPLAGITIGPGPTPALLGDSAFVVTIQDLAGLSPTIALWVDTPDELMGMWRGFAAAPIDSPSLLDDVRSAIAGTVDAAASVNATLAGGQPAPGSDSGRARRGRSSLSTSLQIGAWLIGGPNPPRVVYVHGWGDFDTHEGQQARHGTMMEDIDTSLASFFAEVDQSDTDVVVATTSEFGRRPAYNGSGTDHGTAASHFVIGGSVNGGMIGEQPSLDRLDARGNLVHTVDYRSLYGSLLSEFLAADDASILGGSFEKLPLSVARTSARGYLEPPGPG